MEYLFILINNHGLDNTYRLIDQMVDWLIDWLLACRKNKEQKRAQKHKQHKISKAEKEKQYHLRSRKYEKGGHVGLTGPIDEWFPTRDRAVWEMR